MARAARAPAWAARRPERGLQARVGKSELGRVLSPEALDAAEGGRARLAIEVPGDWLTDPCELIVVVPRRLACARCDGGGCDGCDRSGALRAPEDDDARTVCLRLDQLAAGVAIRVATPFAPETQIAQLIVEIRTGARPSPGVTRRVAPPAPAYAPRVSSWVGVVLLALSAAAAILLSLLAR